MSIFGIMRTGVSGMAAQGSKLGAVSDNIANVNTVGYKRASTEFSSLISEGNHSEYNSGGVETTTRYAISDEGLIMGSTSKTDLAIKGNGFFVVTDAGGTPYMTRAGAFVKNGSQELVNSAGFYLMGYPIQNGDPTVVANSLDGLERINLANVAYEANPTVSGTLKGVLDSNAAVIAPGTLPSDNVAGSTYSSKASIVSYDNLGNKKFLDVYMAKTGTALDTWQAVVFDQAAATAGGFPYAGGPLANVALAFGPTGQLTTAPANFTVAIPGGATATIDFSQVSQVATGETALELAVDGNAPSAVESVDIANDGTVYAVFENGARRATYRIPLATVPSPDQLTPQSGNVYSVSDRSGDVIVGFPESGSFGSIRSGALEQSNVDLATELTAMIESQRSYTANSKVFQTGSEILDVLVNLKR
ncbi:flagellar hook protein FlgE [Bosea sp. OAE506]|uniref:flagellar hook protein FlgE n=1 Tax=Bosea sp. OAE506 TaxID=2663870 RepID=UPI00178A1ECE